MGYFPFSLSSQRGLWLGGAGDPKRSPSRTRPRKKPCENARNEPKKKLVGPGDAFPWAQGGHPALRRPTGVCTHRLSPQVGIEVSLAAQINHEMPFRNKAQLRGGGTRGGAVPGARGLGWCWAAHGHVAGGEQPEPHSVGFHQQISLGEGLGQGHFHLFLVLVL